MADQPSPLPFNQSAPAQKASSGFFTKRPEGPKASDLAELSAEMNGVSRRMRMLEERYTTLHKKIQLGDANLLNFQKGIKKDVGVLSEEITELRKEFLELRDNMRLIIKEIKDCAKSEDFKVLETYINLWEPVNFVTRNEVARLIDSALDSRLADRTRQKL